MSASHPSCTEDLGGRARESSEPKPESLALSSGQLDAAGSLASPGAKGPQEPRILSVQPGKELLRSRRAGLPPCSEMHRDLHPEASERFCVMSLLHLQCQLLVSMGALPPPFIWEKTPMGCKKPTTWLTSTRSSSAEMGLYAVHWGYFRNNSVPSCMCVHPRVCASVCGCTGTF